MTIGIVGALDQEIEAFLKGMTEIKEEQRAGITFYQGKFVGRKVVLCRSGVGKVNASVCTQILIDYYSINATIFTGVAGALNPTLDIGDIVISTDSMQHDMDATALGFKLGEIPYEECYIFKANSELVELAYSVSKEAVENQKTIKGRILSGDQFIANKEKVVQFHTDLKGDCTEMEGAAVAQVCSMNRIPFVIIRSMSDKADGSAEVNFLEFTNLASRHSYLIINGMLQHWKEIGLN